MSDRGLPPDASPACPFIAFEDDRDGRSTRPDHRHRCFAELRPAPRASAHQEAFCLSAGFAACPTFVDWARREAARVRPAAEPAPAVVDDAMPGEPAPPDRDARRDWTSPPPWATAGTAAAAAEAAGRIEAPRPAATSAPIGPDEPLTAAVQQPESSRPSPEAAPALEAAPEAAEAAPALAAAPAVEAPSFLAARAAEPSRSSSSAERGTEEPPYGAARPASASRTTRPSADLDDELEADLGDDEGWAEPGSDEASMRRFGPAAGRSRYDDTHARTTPPRRRPPADPGAPSWEKPRRDEAYPTLRTRAGLSGVSPLLGAGIVIVLAAAALFFLPPLLLGLGGDTKATPTPSASGASASETPAGSPSPSPAPTPFTYVVKSGDTLSGIAKQFGVSIDDIIAANPSLEDPDKLGIGDKLVIPIGGLQPSPSPSPSPETASPSP